jgi:hypothetical protein
LAFANRSAVFQAQRKFKDALVDISLAIDNSYPQHLNHKLLERRKVCTEAIITGHVKVKERDDNDNEKREKEWNTARREKKAYCDEVLFKIKSPNPKIRFAEDFVAIRENKEFGRHVITTKAVRPGTVLIVEDPFVFTLKNGLEDVVTHCASCLRTLNQNGRPCRGCAYVCTYTYILYYIT